MIPPKNSLAFLSFLVVSWWNPQKDLPHNLLNVRSSSGAKYREFYAILMRNLQKRMQTRIFSACWTTYRLCEASSSTLHTVSAGGACQIQFWRLTWASQLAELRLQSKDCLDHHANYSLLRPSVHIRPDCPFPRRFTPHTGDNHKTTIFISFPSSVSRFVVAAAGFRNCVFAQNTAEHSESFFGVEELYLKNGIEMSGKDFLFHSHYVFFGARFSSVGRRVVVCVEPLSWARRGVGEVTDTRAVDDGTKSFILSWALYF